jgi:REP element-mobilizing transposase RayT
MPILAYFLTWTTYGTWLPGDRRCWVHKRGSVETPYQIPNASREAFARSLMPGEPVFLDADERVVVEGAILAACRRKRWSVHALSVRSNHVHIVVTANDQSPERTMANLKAWASRALGQKTHRRWWTIHGSTRYIKAESSLASAIAYVQNQ